MLLGGLWVKLTQKCSTTGTALLGTDRTTTGCALRAQAGSFVRNLPVIVGRCMGCAVTLPGWPCPTNYTPLAYPASGLSEGLAGWRMASSKRVVVVRRPTSSRTSSTASHHHR